MTYLSGVMPKDPNKKRFEAHFTPADAKKLEEQAKRENRSVKNLIETIVMDYLNKKK